MENFVVEIEEKKNYKTRKRSGILWTCLILAAAIAFCLFIGKYEIGIIVFVGALFLVLSLWDNSSKEKYYVTYIEVIDGLVCIKYTNKGESNELKGAIKDFQFKCVMGGGRYGPTEHNLQIYYAGIKILEQYCTGEWSRNLVDETVRRFKACAAESSASS